MTSTWDPNENLKDQIALANLLVADMDKCGPDDVMRLAELVLALNSWILLGGALPDRWQSKAKNFQFGS